MALRLRIFRYFLYFVSLLAVLPLILPTTTFKLSGFDEIRLDIFFIRAVEYLQSTLANRGPWLSPPANQHEEVTCDYHAA